MTMYTPSDDAADCRESILAALRAEHAEIAALIARYLRTRDMPQRACLLPAMCNAVRLHFTVETGVFIPALARCTRDPTLLRRVGAEYATILSVVNELAAVHPGARGREFKVKQLRTLVMSHIERTEGMEGVLCRAARMKLRWSELGLQMASRRDELARSWSA